jgi:hypothetical protein
MNSTPAASRAARMASIVRG